MFVRACVMYTRTFVCLLYVCFCTYVVFLCIRIRCTYVYVVCYLCHECACVHVCAYGTHTYVTEYLCKVLDFGFTNGPIDLVPVLRQGVWDPRGRRKEGREGRVSTNDTKAG